MVEITAEHRREVCGITFLEEARKRDEECERRLLERINRLSPEKQVEINDRIGKETAGMRGIEYVRKFFVLLEKYLVEAYV